MGRLDTETKLEIVVEIVVENWAEIGVKAVVKTGYYAILYNSPLQWPSGGPRCTILSTTTILFTMVSSSLINTEVVTTCSYATNMEY